MVGIALQCAPAVHAASHKPCLPPCCHLQPRIPRQGKVQGQGKSHSEAARCRLTRANSRVCGNQCHPKPGLPSFLPPPPPSSLSCTHRTGKGLVLTSFSAGMNPKWLRHPQCCHSAPRPARHLPLALLQWSCSPRNTSEARGRRASLWDFSTASCPPLAEEAGHHPTPRPR